MKKQSLAVRIAIRRDRELKATMRAIAAAHRVVVASADREVPHGN